MTKIFDTSAVVNHTVIVSCDVHVVSCMLPMHDANVMVPTCIFVNVQQMKNRSPMSNDPPLTEKIVPITILLVALVVLEASSSLRSDSCSVHCTIYNKNRQIQSVIVYFSSIWPSSQPWSPDTMTFVASPKRYNPITWPYLPLDTTDYHQDHLVPSPLLPIPLLMRHRLSFDCRR